MRRLAAMFVLVPMALLGATAAAQPPQIDDLPPLPPAPRGADKAVFDVIVEGQGDAYRRVDGEGSNGLCQISSGTATTEVYEYGRGRGLRVVFTRLSRRAILMQRGGRRSPLVTFNVRGSVTSAAEGEASRSGPVPCAATTEKVGDEAGCGRKARAIDYGLAYARGELTLALAGDVTPPLPSPKLCGANGVESMSGPPVYGWFGPPELKPGALPPRKSSGTSAPSGSALGLRTYASSSTPRIRRSACARSKWPTTARSSASSGFRATAGSRCARGSRR